MALKNVLSGDFERTDYSAMNCFVCHVFLIYLMHSWDTGTFPLKYVLWDVREFKVHRDDTHTHTHTYIT